MLTAGEAPDHAPTAERPKPNSWESFLPTAVTRGSQMLLPEQSPAVVYALGNPYILALYHGLAFSTVRFPASRSSLRTKACRSQRTQ
ncbi:hypothetical protein H8959_011579, partial [Pygathrix nigripes]